MGMRFVVETLSLSLSPALSRCRNTSLSLFLSVRHAVRNVHRAHASHANARDGTTKIHPLYPPHTPDSASGVRGWHERERERAHGPRFLTVNRVRSIYNEWGYRNIVMCRRNTTIPRFVVCVLLVCTYRHHTPPTYRWLHTQERAIRYHTL